MIFVFSHPDMLNRQTTRGCIFFFTWMLMVKQLMLEFDLKLDA